MVATNLYDIDPGVYASHMNMFYRLGRDMDVDLVFCGPFRYAIDNARNLAAKRALEFECDYLFFYDDDMYIMDANIIRIMVEKMIRRSDVHIMQAVAYIRGYPFDTMFFKFTDDEKHELKIFNDWQGKHDADGLVRGDATGCCATLIDCELLKLVPEPWFMTGQKNTEDIYFCMKAREYVQDVGVYLDTTVEVGHLLERAILNTASRRMLTEIHEKYNVDQLWQADKDFVNQAKNTVEPLRPKEIKNPFEEDEKDGNDSH